MKDTGPSTYEIKLKLAIWNFTKFVIGLKDYRKGGFRGKAVREIYVLYEYPYNLIQILVNVSIPSNTKTSTSDEIY